MRHPLDRFLSGGLRYPAFEQPGTDGVLPVVVLIAQSLPDVLMLLYCAGLATIKDFLKEHVVSDIRNQIVRIMVMPNIPVTAGKILYLR